MPEFTIRWEKDPSTLLLPEVYRLKVLDIEPFKKNFYEEGAGEHKDTYFEYWWRITYGSNEYPFARVYDKILLSSEAKSRRKLMWKTFQFLESLGEQNTDFKSRQKLKPEDFIGREVLAEVTIWEPPSGFKGRPAGPRNFIRRYLKSEERKGIKVQSVADLDEDAVF